MSVFKQLLRPVVVGAQALVLDAAHQRQALAAVDALTGHLNELLGVAFEVVQAAAVGEDGGDGAARQLGAVLQVGQHVGQRHVGFVQHHGRGNGRLRGRDAPLANGNVGLAPLQAGRGDAWGLLQGGDAVLDQFVVVKRHTVGGALFDAVPEGFEVGVDEHRFADGNLLAVVGVLDLQAARCLAQHLGDLGPLGFKRSWQDDLAVF